MTTENEMSLERFLDVLRKDVEGFEREMKGYQKISLDQGGVPDKMEYGEWFDQWLTFYTGEI